MTDRLSAEQAAFMAGFQISGEGWNGEYPHEGVTWADLAGRFEEWAESQVPARVRRAVEDCYDGTTRGYIQTIKEVRGLTGWGLRQAKDAVDAERQRRGLSHD